ncbi:MAG: hypothetical protein R3310_17245, partial [Candidatus Competibacteraceae bacterium]|nr:hypothetical protein [Candidatus Competibacteraceae bacterium]
SSWNLSHLDEVTTAQGLELIELLLDDEGRFVDLNGRPLDFERLQGNGGLLTPGGLFLLTDEEFRRRRTALDVTYTRRRNTFSLGLYRESRDFGDDADNRQVLGSNAGWSIRLAPRTGAAVSAEWQQQDGDDDDDQRQAWSLETGLNHNFPGNMAGSVSYLHARSDRRNGEDQFRENRLSLLLQITF